MRGRAPYATGSTPRKAARARAENRQIPLSLVPRLTSLAKEVDDLVVLVTGERQRKDDGVGGGPEDDSRSQRARG
jgi:hypothetical protein